MLGTFFRGAERDDFVAHVLAPLWVAATLLAIPLVWYLSMQ